MDIKPENSISSEESTKSYVENGDTKIDNNPKLPLARKLFGDVIEEENSTIKQTEIKSFYYPLQQTRKRKRKNKIRILPLNYDVTGIFKIPVDTKSFIKHLKWKRRNKKQRRNAIDVDDDITEAFIPNWEPTIECSYTSDYPDRDMEREEILYLDAKSATSETAEPFVDMESYFHMLKWKRLKQKEKINVKDVTTLLRTSSMLETASRCSEWSDHHVKEVEQEAEHSKKALSNLEGIPGCSKWTDDYAIKVQQLERQYLSMDVKSNKTAVSDDMGSYFYKLKWKRNRHKTTINVNQADSTVAFIPNWEPTPGCSYSSAIQGKAIESEERRNLVAVDLSNKTADHYVDIESYFRELKLKSKRKTQMEKIKVKDSTTLALSDFEAVPGCSKWTDKYAIKIKKLENEYLSISNEKNKTMSNFLQITPGCSEWVDSHTKKIESLQKNNSDSSAFQGNVKESEERIYLDPLDLSKKNSGVVELNTKVVPIDNNLLACSGNNSLNIHHDSEYTCDQCNYKCSQPSQLKRHKLDHSTNRTLMCQSCPYKTKYPRNLKSHTLWTHGNTAAYACSQCDFRCALPYQFHCHQNKHSSITWYTCDVCYFKAKSPSHLKSHKLIHSSARPFQCSFCDYKSKRNHDMRAHEKIHDPKKRYLCTDCPYSTNKKSNLADHQNTHLSEMPFVCEACGKRYCHPASLRRHRRIKHSQEIDLV